MAKTKPSLRDRIRAANDRPLAPVEVPEWDATIYFRSMSLRERLDLQESLGDQDTIQFRDLLARTLLDERGERIFTDEDAAIFDEKSPEVVIRLGKAAMDFHGLSPEATEAASKNSEPSPSA